MDKGQLQAMIFHNSGMNPYQLISVMKAVDQYKDECLRKHFGMAPAVLKPLAWEDTLSHQSQKCPLTMNTYSMVGDSKDKIVCKMIPAVGLKVQHVGDGYENVLEASEGIERHRNQRLRDQLQ